MPSADDVRRVALALPHAYEALVRDQVKFRVGRIVFVALSRDETVMGFGFPRELRAAAVDAESDSDADEYRESDAIDGKRTLAPFLLGVAEDDGAGSCRTVPACDAAPSSSPSDESAYANPP